MIVERESLVENNKWLQLPLDWQRHSSHLGRVDCGRQPELIGSSKYDHVWLVGVQESLVRQVPITVSRLTCSQYAAASFNGSQRQMQLRVSAYCWYLTPKLLMALPTANTPYRGDDRIAADPAQNPAVGRNGSRADLTNDGLPSQIVIVAGWTDKGTTHPV